MSAGEALVVVYLVAGTLVVVADMVRRYVGTWQVSRWPSALVGVRWFSASRVLWVVIPGVLLTVHLGAAQCAVCRYDADDGRHLPIGECGVIGPCPDPDAHHAYRRAPLLQRRRTTTAWDAAL